MFRILFVFSKIFLRKYLETWVLLSVNIPRLDFLDCWTRFSAFWSDILYLRNSNTKTLFLKGTRLSYIVERTIPNLCWKIFLQRLYQRYSNESHWIRNHTCKILTIDWNLTDLRNASCSIFSNTHNSNFNTYRKIALISYLLA